MCEICDGATPAQALERARGLVRRHGWAVQAVPPDRGSPGWAYTIGLVPSYGHAELVAVDHDVRRAARRLNAVGALVRDGDEVAAGDVVELPDGRSVDVLEVHPRHLAAGAMAVWPEVVGPGHQLRALQLFGRWLPGGDGVRLDRPRPRLAAAGLRP